MLFPKLATNVGPKEKIQIPRTNPMFKCMSQWSGHVKSEASSSWAREKRGGGGEEVVGLEKREREANILQLSISRLKRHPPQEPPAFALFSSPCGRFIHLAVPGLCKSGVAPSWRSETRVAQEQGVPGEP